MKQTWVAMAALLAVFRAAATEVSLSCHGPDGAPVPHTVVKAIREDFQGPPLRGRASGGLCRIDLPSGVHWVKAEAPGMRSLAIRVEGGHTSDRALRLLPVQGSDGAAQRRLQELVNRDRAVRQALAEAQQAGDAQRIEEAARDMEKVDASHRVEVATWLQGRGFPRASEVGLEGVGAFWLLLQHDPEQLAGQMPALRAAVAAGELPRSDFALSADRVDMMQGRPQRFGSQLQQDASGKLVLHPLVDSERVDAWRAEMDLEPLATYLKRLAP